MSDHGVKAGDAGAVWRWRTLGVAAFPVLLWFVAYFFLRGDTGFWADDHYQNLRGPDGSPPALALLRKWPLWTWGMDRGFFVRPLFYLTLPAWTTLIWNHPGIAHLVQALFHAGVVVLFWRLMRKMGMHRRAAAATALLFLVYPGHYEAVLWVGAFPTLWSVAIMLGVLFTTIGFARACRGWWRVPLIAAGCFTACCLNEQPVAVVAVLPLAYLAGVPVGQPLWTRRNVIRMLVVWLVAGAAVVTYLVLLTSSTPPGFRGSGQSIVAVAALPVRLIEFSRRVVNQTALVGFGRGAFSTGWTTICEAGVWSWLSAGALGVAGVFWIVTPRRSGVKGQPAEMPGVRRGILAALGLGVFITGWIPILVITNYPPDSRMRYWPCIGLAFAAAAACSGARNARTGGPSRRLRESRYFVVARAALAILLIAGTVPIIGTQAAYRARWRQDRSEGEQLRVLAPDPAPYTIFQPLTIGTTIPKTGSAELDGRFHALWWYPWSPRKFIQREYGRENISAMYWQGIVSPVLGANEQGILYGIRLGPRYAVREGEGSRLPWDHVIPFVVDETGRLRIVTIVEIPGLDGDAAVRIQVPQAAGVESLVYQLPRK